jgi:hypothetical protein
MGIKETCSRNVFAVQRIKITNNCTKRNLPATGKKSLTCGFIIFTPFSRKKNLSVDMLERTLITGRK